MRPIHLRVMAVLILDTYIDAFFLINNLHSNITQHDQFHFTSSLTHFSTNKINYNQYYTSTPVYVLSTTVSHF